MPFQPAHPCHPHLLEAVVSSACLLFPPNTSRCESVSMMAPIQNEMTSHRVEPPLSGCRPGWRAEGGLRKSQRHSRAGDTLEHAALSKKITTKNRPRTFIEPGWLPLESTARHSRRRTRAHSTIGRGEHDDLAPVPALVWALLVLCIPALRAGNWVSITNAAADRDTHGVDIHRQRALQPSPSSWAGLSRSERRNEFSPPYTFCCYVLWVHLALP